MISQFLITRYNICHEELEGKKWSSEWLQQRIPLFRQYCVPSVLEQTNQNFEWIILVDEKTKKTDIIDIKQCSLDRATILLVGNDYLQTLRDYISQNRLDTVLTTRLDNDDAISLDFMEKVLYYANHVQKPSFLNFREGYVLLEGRLWKRYGLSNSFISLVENDNMTVFTKKHEDVKDFAPLIQCDHKPCWISVHHDSNVCVRDNYEWPMFIRESYGYAKTEICLKSLYGHFARKIQEKISLL